MRIIFCCFLLVTAFLVFMFGVEVANHTSIAPWVHHNTTEILVLQDENLSDEDIIIHFKNVQEQFGVYLLQVIWSNMGRSISLYTTDTTLDGKVSLSSGVFPDNHADGFLSNKQSFCTLQFGTFHYFNTQDRTVFIYPIEAILEHAGPEGIFFINTTDEFKVASIINYLEESLVGSVYIRGTHEINRGEILTWTAMANLPLTALIGIVCVLFAFITVRYVLSLRKNSALMVIEGYSKRRIVFEHLLVSLSIFLISFIAISSCIIIYLIFSSNIYFWWMFVRGVLIFHIAAFTLFALTAFCMIALHSTRNNAINVIAGKKPNLTLSIMHLFAKNIVLVMIVSASFQFQIQATYLEERQQAGINWHQAENVYTTVMRVTADMGCLISRRPVEIKSRHLYEDLSNELGLFLIDASNFQQMEDGRYLWEWNTTDDIKSSLTLNGKTITINENYLHRHPVYAVDGSPAVDLLVYDPFVQNILVPVALTLHEAYIYQNFLYSFYFTKVEVANIYNRVLGQPLDETLVEQLSINIIFVEDGVRYFTYNPRLAESTHNVITDPIVIIDTLIIDASYYDSWLTRSAFFESSGANPLKELRSHVVHNNMGAALSNVNSVFGLHTESMREAGENLRILALVGVALLLVYIFSLCTFIASYFEQHKYVIYVKRLFGYSNIRCSWHMIIFMTIPMVLILLLFPITWYVVAVLVTIEIMMTVIISYAVGSKSFSELRRGVR